MALHAIFRSLLAAPAAGNATTRRGPDVLVHVASSLDAQNIPVVILEENPATDASDLGGEAEASSIAAEIHEQRPHAQQPRLRGG
jgi:hypothetical protein